MKSICTSKSAGIRKQVGEFLGEEGKSDNSEKLLLQAMEIYKSLFGEEHLEMLATMHALAWMYQGQGRHAEAAKLREQVVEKRIKILGQNTHKH